MCEIHGYFGRSRTEIEPYLPLMVNRMLDIGCGDGATTAFVQSRRLVAWAGGVEVSPDAAERAKGHFSEVWCGDVEKLDFDRKIPALSLDLILCLDVLEHLVDPWTVVKRLSVLIARRAPYHFCAQYQELENSSQSCFSAANSAYRDAGLLDRSHLRFFVKETAEELAVAAIEIATGWNPSTARERGRPVARSVEKAQIGVMSATRGVHENTGSMRIVPPPMQRDPRPAGGRSA